MKYFIELHNRTAQKQKTVEATYFLLLLRLEPHVILTAADYLLVNYVFTAQVIYSSESYQEKRVSEYYNSVKNICRDTYQTVWAVHTS